MQVDYHQEPYQFRKVVKLFKDVRILLFLLSCIAFGVCIGTVWQFHLWFVKRKRNLCLHRILIFLC